MEPTLAQNPVLHYLAVVRAARDFGLSADQLDRLTRRFHAAPSAVEAFAEAAADALLDRANDSPRKYSA
jgi:hypothetical protein